MKKILISISFGISFFLITVLLMQNNVFAQSSDIEGRTIKWDKVEGISASDLNKGIYADDKFIVVGSNGLILTSETGDNWVERNSNTNADLYNIGWDGSRFYVISQKEILLSSDGENWSAYPFNNIKEVTYSGGKFFGTGIGNSNIYCSDDGKEWQTMELDRVPTYFKNNYYIINNGYISKSSDLINWDKIQDISNAQEFYIYNDELFIQTKNSIRYTVDSITWITLYNKTEKNIRISWGSLLWDGSNYIFKVDDSIFSSTPDGVSTELTKIRSIDKDDLVNIRIIFDGEKYILIGWEPTTIDPKAHVLTTTDFINWSYEYSKSRMRASDIIFSGNKYIVIGLYRFILESDDGYNWVENSFHNQAFYSILWDGEKFISGALDNDAAIMNVSYDGVNWDYSSTLDSGYYTRIAYNGSKYVAIGRQLVNKKGTIITSTDGINWTEIYVNTDIQLLGITWNGDMFVAVGYSGIILVSYDGENWVLAESNTDKQINAVVWGDDKFVAVGNGIVLTSADGYTWEKSYNLNDMLYNIAYGNGRYIVTGFTNYILSSNDGVKWDKVTSKQSCDYYSFVKFLDGKFLLHNGLSLYESTDGLNWAEVSSDIPRHATDIEYNGEYFIMVGNEGIVRLGYIENKVKLNGKLMKMIHEPIFVDGNMMVPFKDIFEAFGGKIEDWNSYTNTLTGKVNNKTLIIKVGTKIINLDGKEYVTSIPTQLINDSTYISLRSLCELLNAKVTWNSNSCTAEVTTD